MSDPKTNRRLALNFQGESNTKPLKVYVGPSLLRQIDLLALEARRTRSEWMRHVLERAVTGSE